MSTRIHTNDTDGTLAALEVELPQGQHDILLVEDTIELKDALVQQLEVLGYECTAVETCAEAREAIGEGSFSCALIDVGLPDGSGIDLLAEFADAAPTMVCVILTGNAESENIIQAMRLGAFDYLLKPVDLMTLRTGVSRATTHHQAVRDRAMLVQLLRNERDSLRQRIDEATKDIRQYAHNLEASNALLHGLLRLDQLSSEFTSDEGLFREVFKEVKTHTPLRCLSLTSFSGQELLITYESDDEISIVTCGGEDSNGTANKRTSAFDEATLKSCILENTGLDMAEFKTSSYAQEFWGRTVCSVSFFHDTNYSPDEVEQEFLEMCAHFIAFEWQRSRLMLHGAQQAGIGNIAQELAKTFLQSLTAVRTTTDFLSETANDEETQDGLSIIGEHTDYLVAQTQSFQKLARMRLDSVETVQLQEYVEQSLNLLNNAIRQRAVVVTKDFEIPGQCILLNGTALASTFLDLISTAVRIAGTEGAIAIHISEGPDDRVLCQISHEVASGDVHGETGLSNGQSSIMDSVKAHPRFMLAQRTVQACGGHLNLEGDGSARSAFQISLPRNGLELSTT